jgi:EmrB/QacA subfamily drug resistance transporter
LSVTAHRRAWLGETAPGYLLSRGDTLLVFGGLMLGLLLSALNQTIVATALPAIVEDLGGLQQYSWVFSAYMLLSTVTVPVFGRLSDIHGRRPYFVLGLVLFMAGGVVGATASSMEQIVAARGIQGLAAGALIPLSYAAIGDLVPPSDRGRWQGVIGAVFAFASIVGPLTGGWLTDHAHWRWVFLVSLPVGALALVVVLARLRTRPHPERAQRVDVPGALLLTASLSALLYGVVELGARGELWDPHVGGALAAGLVLSLALVRQQRRAAEPFVPAELLGDRVCRLASIGSFAAGAAFFICVMFVPLYAQGVLGAPATEAGLVLMPFMLVVFLTSIWSGHRIARTGRYR